MLFEKERKIYENVKSIFQTDEMNIFVVIIIMK